MHAREPVLLICHAFPPIFDIGGRRWAKFAKELARRGHPVHVIRAEKQPGTPDSLWLADGLQPGITHHPLPLRYPAVLIKHHVNSIGDKIMYRLWKKVLPLPTIGNWYDHSIFWRSQLKREVARLVREKGIHQVIVTGFPFRLMDQVLELRRSLPQLRFTMDFRDEWTWGGQYGMASIGARRVQEERAIEERVIRGADVVTTPHERIVEHLQCTYPSEAHKLRLLPHAVDPDDFDRSVSRAANGAFRMVYAGSLYGAEEAQHYFARLVQAFKALRQGWPEVLAKCRLDLYITGHDTRWYEDQVVQAGLTNNIRFHAPLPPKEIFKKICAANMVILYIPKANKNILGTKFQEIFYSGTPILHVGEPGLVSRTIQERRMGSSLTVDELVPELPRIIAGERRVEVDRQADHSAYLLANVTDLLLSEVLV
jgi:glycosyltransferase involved in cell wall biosynthesis